MAYILYRIAVYLLLPFILISLVTRGFKNRAYWQNLDERLGFAPKPMNNSGIYDYWIHAVSVGEVRAAVPVILELIKQQESQGHILLTVTTPTGRAMAEMMLKKNLGEQVSLCYLPYDVGVFIHTFFNRTQPKKAIVMETEVWPNVVKQARKKGIPLTYLNVRLSEKSLAKYLKVKNLSKDIFTSIGLFAAQGESDSKHLQQLGVSPEKIVVTGSLKFDMTVPEDIHEQARQFRSTMKNDRPVFICGSTRDGEEQKLISVFKELKANTPNLLMIIVPRHPERFELVAQLCTNADLNVVKRSANSGVISDIVDVYLGDTMGDLALLYAASDVAFVGGSLLPLGGQNILEPCALGVPVVFGQHVFNFKEIAAMVVASEAGMQVTDESDLVAKVNELLKNKKQRERIAENGLQLIENNKGALDKVMSLV